MTDSRRRRAAFSLIEILVVVMLLSAGILPIYSLMKSGQRRIVRADTRVIATLYGASAIELARTLGYARAQKLNMEKDFVELRENAAKNGFNVDFACNLQPLLPLPKGAKPVHLLRVIVSVSANNRTFTDIPVLRFVTILTDPRFNYY
ncbi:MAG TPA: prepilin-type N-terminal cleavage/methylation domain-containing protein [Candidatus Ozemobacteraceae bacterium]|nr:prepilin-type N-terminal cleavage/methylation domain-containing protein [Candidatus Ozemobacteraceae bacterium]